MLNDPCPIIPVAENWRWHSKTLADVAIAESSITTALSLASTTFCTSLFLRSKAATCFEPRVAVLRGQMYVLSRLSSPRTVKSQIPSDD